MAAVWFEKRTAGIHPRDSGRPSSLILCNVLSQSVSFLSLSLSFHFFLQLSLAFYISCFHSLFLWSLNLETLSQIVAVFSADCGEPSVCGACDVATVLITSANEDETCEAGERQCLHVEAPLCIFYFSPVWTCSVCVCCLTDPCSESTLRIPPSCLIISSVLFHTHVSSLGSPPPPPPLYSARLHLSHLLSTLTPSRTKRGTAAVTVKEGKSPWGWQRNKNMRGGERGSVEGD